MQNSGQMSGIRAPSVREGRLTSEVAKAGHVLLREYLRVLEARAERRDVGGGERSLEGVQDDAVRAVADGVDVLRSKALVSQVQVRGEEGAEKRRDTHDLPAVGHELGNHVVELFGRYAHEAARLRVVCVRLVQLRIRACAPGGSGTSQEERMSTAPVMRITLWWMCG